MAAIHAALVAASQQIGAVKKSQRNTAPGGNYNFRGVDQVVNAASPAFLNLGILVTPEVLELNYRQQEVGNKRSWMQNVTVKVRYTFTATEDGSQISATTVGEASDSGDKATPKAMSVAFRTALLQTLMLPTDDPDPDSYSYGHGDPEPTAGTTRDQARALVKLAPNGTTDPVAWVKEQAAARRLDFNLSSDMNALLDALTKDYIANATATGEARESDARLAERMGGGEL